MVDANENESRSFSEQQPYFARVFWSNKERVKVLIYFTSILIVYGTRSPEYQNVAKKKRAKEHFGLSGMS